MLKSGLLCIYMYIVIKIYIIQCKLMNNDQNTDLCLLQPALELVLSAQLPN